MVESYDPEQRGGTFQTNIERVQDNNQGRSSFQKMADNYDPTLHRGATFQTNIERVPDNDI